MTENEPELVQREKSSIGPILVMGLIFLPLLYVLSPPILYPLLSGPDDETFRTLYLPLIYLSQEFDQIQNFYDWYGRLFPWIP
ncbi:hypothetical protein OAK47_01500 [Planctomycetaceae bacterium]|jgi:hypothetical protein|nr:hypothetical protein [Planctomycetaceae bacterium]MDC0261876.1 hypothetical protein [Planctomycetaceae bacterium]MDC0273411.1 hypothetical protein [Planctomycetaceae bacterium]